jgi:single-stranded-DNA-specific exonuclease
MIWKTKQKKTENIIDQLLINRGIKLSEKKGFFDPQLVDLYDPMLLPDMNKALKLFLAKTKSKSKIAIFADYDADGIPGGALLKELINLFGLEPIVYIPTREEGYGLSKKAVDYFLKRKADLMIMIDCGVANINEIEYAKKEGLETIILDHHETKEVLPPAEAVVDAKREDSQYPFREICGAAVGFKFAQALAKKSEKVNESFLRWSLDLIGISTITDMVPLVDENRTFAKWGLEVLKQTKRVGLRELYKTAGFLPKEITSYQVGFQIGPRINAPGRMDHANRAYYLLTEKDLTKAAEIAGQIEKINTQRQETIEKVFQEAKDKIDQQGLADNKLILLRNRNWPKGIIGLVANRIKDQYYLPTIILNMDDNYSEGSARSIKDVNILKLLDRHKQQLDRYGGHNMAAGLRIKNSRYQQFYDDLITYANNKLKGKKLEPVLEADMEIGLNEINGKLYNKLKKFEPFGIGNPRPVFISRAVRLLEYRYVGKEEKHLKLSISSDDSRFDGILFNFESDFKLKTNMTLDIAYNIDINSYLGKDNLELNIKEIKKHG